MRLHRRAVHPIWSAVIVIVCVLVASTGCAETAGSGRAAPTEGASPATKVLPASSDAVAQVCRECATGEKPEKVEGSARLVGMVQVLEVTIEDGAYVPNAFEAKARVPVRVVFLGTAKGCLAKPTFPSLDRSVDLAGDDHASVNLGSLAAGTYEFTCGMGLNRGTITVR